MRPRMLVKLCKFVLFLGVVTLVYFLFAKCRNFDVDVKSKLANLSKIQANLSKFLAKWNVITSLQSSEKDVMAQRNEMQDQNNNESKQTSRGSIANSNLNEFISLLKEHEKVEANERNTQFERFMTKMMNAVQRQRKTDDVSEEIAGEHLPKPTTFSAMEKMTTTNTGSRNVQQKAFLDKMKAAGIEYKTNFFRDPKNQQRPAIFYREALPPVGKVPNTTVFLLHSEKYNSEVWLSIGTFFVLPSSGFRVIAIDLPGYGLSKNVPESPTRSERSRLLAAIILTLSPQGNRVVVSPGKSGVYSVPLVMNYHFILEGVVFIAPNFTSEYTSSKYKDITVAALVIFGANDNTMLHIASLDNLEHLANRKIYTISNAGHDCYVDQPESFHRLVKKFLVSGITASKRKAVE